MRITPENIDSVCDGVGWGIEEGIRPIVLKLNELGMETEASCEGHANRALPFPWVDFSNWGRYIETALREFYATEYNPAAVLCVKEYASYDRLEVILGKGATAEDGRKEMMRFLAWLEAKFQT